MRDDALNGVAKVLDGITRRLERSA